MDVQARPAYDVWLRYDGGTEGEVDLKDLVGRRVFRAWEDLAFFESVRLAPHGALVWGDSSDLCPDAMRLRLAGKSRPAGVRAGPLSDVRFPEPQHPYRA